MGWQVNKLTGERRFVPDAGGGGTMPIPQMSGGPAGGGGLPMGGNSPFSGQSMENLKTLLFMAALSDPKNVSRYSGLTTLAEGLGPGAGQTTEMKNRAAAVQPAMIAINEALRVGHPETSLVGAYLNQFKSSKLGGRGVDRLTKEASARYSLLRPNVVRALQGARMSDEDMRAAAAYVPTIIDSKENAEVKLQNLQRVLTLIAQGSISKGQVGQMLFSGGMGGF